MKNKYKGAPARFKPGTRLEVAASPDRAVRTLRDSEFERLKKRLLIERLEMVVEPAFNLCVRRAANEAAALAWVTPYPLLVFPALFEEKTHLAVLQAKRQEQVRSRSRKLLPIV